MSSSTGESLRFDGEVAIVTGAGRGLGAAYARLLADRGCRVLVNDLGVDVFGAESGEDPAAEVARDIVDRGGEAEPDGGDITVGAAEIVAHALDRFGRLDLVINNAGVLSRSPFVSVSSEQLRAAFDVHVVGALALTQAAWDHLGAAPAGRVLFTSSPGVFGIPGSLAYAVAKAGVVGATRTLALEAASTGIRVNAVLPAGMSRMSVGTPGAAATMEDLMREHFDPRHVAAFVAWLMHAQTTVHGEMFTVGGGRAARVFLGEGPGAVADAWEPERWPDRRDALLATAPCVAPGSAFDELRYAVAALGADVRQAFERTFGPPAGVRSAPGEQRQEAQA